MTTRVAERQCVRQVGMSGTSYLAVAQWFTAREQPPHLAAIDPWEGVSDVYRGLVMRVGCPTPDSPQLLQHCGSSFGRSRKRTSSPKPSATR